jgi:hypothetical protein
MSQVAIEERIQALEQEVASLKLKLGTTKDSKDWRKTVGMFDDDPGILEIQRLGQEYRQKDREATSS